MDAVAEAIRSHDRFLVTTHENPDGDALGSLLAMKLTLDNLGKDSVMYLAGEAPLPREYAWMPFGELRRQPPDDASERVLLALDCANESRLGPDPEILVTAPLVVNVDHHHDNSRFGGINLVVADASSTGEIIRDVIERLGVELTPDLAEALYIALVTDTGRFQYANTTPKALRLAGRARRGRGRRAQDLPGRVRERPVREAEAPRTRARARAGVRGRAARRLVPAAGRLQGGRRGRALLGGHHRLPAGGRGSGHGGA